MVVLAQYTLAPGRLRPVWWSVTLPLTSWLVAGRYAADTIAARMSLFIKED
jgi:hypothetical protein